jgi:hypothetical protein
VAKKKLVAKASRAKSPAKPSAGAGVGAKAVSKKKVNKKKSAGTGAAKRKSTSHKWKPIEEYTDEEYTDKVSTSFILAGIADAMGMKKYNNPEYIMKFMD